MTRLLIRLFVRNPDSPGEPAVRTAYGLLAGWTGVGLNLLLGAAKLFIGFLVGSIAIQADAANNLSDVGASAVTIVGFRMAGKPADREHPFGHGRAEYVAGLVAAFLILLLGVELLGESIGRILRPAPVSFSWPAVLILILSIAAKVWLGRFTAGIGRKIESPAMAAAATDSRSDAAATGAVLLSTLLSPFVSFPLDGWMGGLAALFVLWSGVKVLRSTVSALLGEAPSPELLRELEERLLAYGEIRGVHDIRIHQYGAGRVLATVHAEVAGESGVAAVHAAIDRAEREIGAAMGMELTIHMDPV